MLINIYNCSKDPILNRLSYNEKFSFVFSNSEISLKIIIIIIIIKKKKKKKKKKKNLKKKKF